MGKAIVGTALATAAAAVVGSVASREGVQNWYPTLRKPSFNPPNAAFPIAWTTLYADIAVTSASAINRFRADGDDAKARAYTAALGSTSCSTPAGVGCSSRRTSWGCRRWRPRALAASSADLARRAGEADPKLGVALAPYPLWCSFATLLSTAIWRLNR